jgi:hypothetical protein
MQLDFIAVTRAVKVSQPGGMRTYGITTECQIGLRPSVMPLPKDSLLG